MSKELLLKHRDSLNKLVKEHRGYPFDDSLHWNEHFIKRDGSIVDFIETKWAYEREYQNRLVTLLWNRSRRTCETAYDSDDIDDGRYTERDIQNYSFDTNFKDDWFPIAEEVRGSEYCRIPFYDDVDYCERKLIELGLIKGDKKALVEFFIRYWGLQKDPYLA